MQSSRSTDIRRLESRAAFQLRGNARRRTSGRARRVRRDGFGAGRLTNALLRLRSHRRPGSGGGPRPFATGRWSVRQRARDGWLQSMRVGVPFETGALSAPIPPPAATRVVRFSETQRAFISTAGCFPPRSARVRGAHRNGRALDGREPDPGRSRLPFASGALQVARGRRADAHPLWRDTVVVPHGVRRRTVRRCAVRSP